MPNGFFGKKLAKKVYNRKKEHRHGISHIRNSLHDKFQFKLAILNSCTKLTNTVISNLKKNKIKITIEVYIFELVKFQL